MGDPGRKELNSSGFLKPLPVPTELRAERRQDLERKGLTWDAAGSHGASFSFPSTWEGPPGVSPMTRKRERGERASASVVRG